MNNLLHFPTCYPFQCSCLPAATHFYLESFWYSLKKLVFSISCSTCLLEINCLSFYFFEAFFISPSLFMVTSAGLRILSRAVFKLLFHNFKMSCNSLLFSIETIENSAAHLKFTLLKLFLRCFCLWFSESCLSWTRCGFLFISLAWVILLELLESKTEVLISFKNISSFTLSASKVPYILKWNVGNSYIYIYNLCGNKHL